MADVQFGQFVVGQIGDRETLLGQARQQCAARVVFRVGLHADKDVRFAAGVVAVVEFGDLALADGFAERLEAAGLLGDGHGDDRFAAFTQFGALGDVAQAVEVDVGTGVDGHKVWPLTPRNSTYFLIPATPKAPAGSVIERVSS